MSQIQKAVDTITQHNGTDLVLVSTSEISVTYRNKEATIAGTIVRLIDLETELWECNAWISRGQQRVSIIADSHQLDGALTRAIECARFLGRLS